MTVVPLVEARGPLLTEDDLIAFGREVEEIL